MAYKMTPARRAALRKAQQASARKRSRGGRKKKKSSKKRRIARNVTAVAVVGAAGYATYKGRGKVKSAARKKAENNKAVRTAVASKLLAERRNSTRKPVKGLKMDKRYRMGRPDVRRKRKAKRG